MSLTNPNGWTCPRCANTGAYWSRRRWYRCTVCAITIGDQRTGEEIAAALPESIRVERMRARV